MRKFRNNLINRILAAFLIMGILAVSIPLDVYAENETESIEKSGEISSIDDELDDFSEDDILTNEDVSGEKADEEFAESESVSEKLINEDNSFEYASNETNQGSERVSLSTEQIEAKEALCKDIDAVSNATAGEEYVNNQVVMLCDSEEDAFFYGQEYEKSTGHQFSLISFQYGVATFEISEEPIVNDAFGTNDDENVVSEQYDKLLYNSDTVEAAVEIAADLDNNLPAVTPNYYLEFGSATDNEAFTDKFLKKTVKSGETETDVLEYQFYHDVIGSKYVFDEMDELSQKGDEYTGPLGRDFLDNLEKIVVEVVDSGINESHEDFVDPLTGESAIYHPEGFYSGPEQYKDTYGHGTNVAGIIANVSNDKGGRGVASGVLVKPADVCETNKPVTAACLAAVKAATMRKSLYNEGVRDDDNSDEITSENICVINLSLGSTSYSSSWKKVIDDAVNEGIVIVASAGNNGDSVPVYPASYDGVISVASVNALGFRSAFSCYGRYVDVAAPGGDRFRRINGTEIEEQNIYASGITDSSAYIPYQGTSQASPMVAALAALLLAQNPDYSPADIERIIEATSREYDSDDFVGAGIINVAAALGIPTGLCDVSADVPCGIINDNTEIHLRSEYASRGGSDYEGMIYYTLDGSIPDMDSNPDSTKVYNVKDDIPIVLSKELVGNIVTIMARSSLFGTMGEVNSFSYRFSAPKMIIKSSSGTSSLAIGKALKLTAVNEETKKKCNVRWNSSDSSRATVDDNGNVKALASGENITITAISVDGSYEDAKFNIDVMPMAVRVEMDPITQTVGADGDILIGLYDNNTIRLMVNKEIDGELVRYDINTGTVYDKEASVADRKYHIYPEKASQEVVFSSSNANIATVSEKGVVTPVKSGTVTIKIIAADGSKVYDSFKVKCECGVSSISLAPKNGKNYVAAGQKFTPVLTFNDGKSVPDNKTVKWKLINTIPGMSDYATINEKTGVVTVKYDCAVSFIGVSAPQIVAYSEIYGVTSSPISVNIYPSTGKIMPSERMTKLPEYVNGIYYLGKGDSVKVKELFSATDKQSISERAPRCIVANNFDMGTVVTSDNNKIVDVIKSDTKEYNFVARGAGKAIVTVKADDGSGVYYRQKIVVLDSLTVKCKSTSVLTPESSLIYVPYLNGSASIPSGLKIKWSLSSSEEDECEDKITGKVIENKVVVSYKDGKSVSSRKDIYLTAKLINPDHPKKADGKTDYVICNLVTAVRVTAAGETTQSVGIKVNGNETDEIVSDTIGERIRITPYSMPENAIQDSYTYKSSNEKVAKLFRLGSEEFIEAVGNGTCYLTVTAGDGSKKSKRIKVIVSQKVTSVNLVSKTGVCSVAAGGKISLKTDINAGINEKPADKLRTKVAYSISDEDERKYAKVDSKGTLTAISAGRDAEGNPQKISITVRATVDGVCDETDILIVPSIQSLSVAEESSQRLKNVKLRTMLGGWMSDPEGCIYKSDEFVTAEDFSVKCSNVNMQLTDALERGCVASWTARSTNTKVVRTEYIDATETSPAGYRIVPVAKGSAKIRISVDANGKTKDIPVSVISPLSELVINRKSGGLTYESESADIKASSRITFKTTAREGASNNGIKYEFCGSPDEISEMKKYAVLSPSGVLSAKKASVIGTQTRVIKVCSKANDIWGAKSNVYTVNILPGIVYIRDLAVRPTTDIYNLASGYKVNMRATCNADATSRKIGWKIYDEGASDDNEGSNYATINQNGEVKANLGLTESHIVEVVAVAKEGLGESARSSRVKLVLYPSVKSLLVISESGIKTVNVGDYLKLHVEPQGSLGTENCSEYRVTYTTSSAKVYLDENPETKEYDGSHFKVYGLQKGKITITVTALDGSNKSVKYTVSCE